MYVSQPTQGSVFGVPCQHSHARLWCTRLKDLFTVLFVSLGYSFESRPYSRTAGTEGSVVTRGLSINRCSRELRQLRRLDANQAEPCFLLLTHEDKKWLYELVSPRGEVQDLLIQWKIQCSLEKLSKFLCFFLSFIISGKLKFMLDLLIHQKLGIVLETLNQKLRCDVFCFERPFIRTGDYLL